MPYFVQFPHPGGEHSPSPRKVGTVMPWNVGNHKRKFIRASASYLDVAGREQRGDVAFWGEWEAQSRVLDGWPKDGKKPRFLHEPMYDAPADGVKHQNIDPFVFGDSFLYTNCKQRNITWLRQLTPGSVIVFGSGQGHGFVLDTVFVVGEGAQDYRLGDRAVLPDRPDAEQLIFRPLSTGNRHMGESCVAYRSKQYVGTQRSPFSFVPCRPLDEAARFERPVLEPIGPLSELINPQLKMAARRRELTDEQLQSAWQHIREVVEGQRLSLAVQLDLPANIRL